MLATGGHCSLSVRHTAFTYMPPHLPSLQLATYVAFGAEVYAWFCIGEIVGRGFSLTGYSV